MTIKELYNYLTNALNNCKDDVDYDVEFWLDLENTSIPCKISSIGQFSVIPDMTISVKPIDTKLYSTRELTEEELDYKQKYEKLKQDVITLYNRNI